MAWVVDTSVLPDIRLNDPTFGVRSASTRCNRRFSDRSASTGWSHGIGRTPKRRTAAGRHGMIATDARVILARSGCDPDARG